MSRPPPLRVAIAGLGTVGATVARSLVEDGERLAMRAGRELELVAVSARRRDADRGFALGDVVWWDDAVDMAGHAEFDVLVELIGGSDGTAREVIRAALARGRDVVSANKALLAHHGADLAEQAEQRGCNIGFEAAVAGGIPVIKTLREGLAGDRILRVSGILNGTTNFILTEMRRTGRDFADVLAEAQRLGYAEADPSFDVDGVDAAHKLTLLASLAFGTRPDFTSVHVEGIRNVSAMDMSYATEFGYAIKLLGTASLGPNGLEQRVHPTMVPLDNPLAHVDGAFNAIVAEGAAVGLSFLQGRGAGGAPTSTAVLADLIDLARGRRLPAFARPVDGLERSRAMSIDDHVGCYFLRLMVVDRPGVIADVTAALRDARVSLEAMLQRRRSPGETVPVVLITHETREAELRRALDRIAGLGSVVEPPHVIRVLDPVQAFKKS